MSGLHNSVGFNLSLIKTWISLIYVKTVTFCLRYACITFILLTYEDWISKLVKILKQKNLPLDQKLTSAMSLPAVPNLFILKGFPHPWVLIWRSTVKCFRSISIARPCALMGKTGVAETVPQLEDHPPFLPEPSTQAFPCSAITHSFGFHKFGITCWT